MKSNFHASFLTKRSVAFCASLLVSCLAAFQSQAQIVTMTDGTSVANVNLSSSAGMYQWSVGGQNQLHQQWFWYSIGSGSQHSIDTISAPVYTQPSANVVNSTYANNAFSLTVGYTLTSGGTGQSDIQEDIHIKNLTAGPLDLHFYQYSDFDLGGTPGGNQVWIDNNNAIQQKGTTAIVEGIIDPSASDYEANVVGGTGSTLYKLTNLSGLVLNNNGYASGDVTWAFQWDLLNNLGPNGSPTDTVEILKDKDLTVTVVPEPTSTALLTLVLGACGVARRRQS